MGPKQTLKSHRIRGHSVAHFSLISPPLVSLPPRGPKVACAYIQHGNRVRSHMPLFGCACQRDYVCIYTCKIRKNTPIYSSPEFPSSLCLCTSFSNPLREPAFRLRVCHYVLRPCSIRVTVRHRGMETPLMETILTFASVSLRKMETLLLGSWWP